MQRFVLEVAIRQKLLELVGERIVVLGNVLCVVRQVAMLLMVEVL
jgi:hypothetical protein